MQQWIQLISHHDLLILNMFLENKSSSCQSQEIFSSFWLWSYYFQAIAHSYHWGSPVCQQVYAFTNNRNNTNWFVRKNRCLEIGFTADAQPTAQGLHLILSKLLQGLAGCWVSKWESVPAQKHSLMLCWHGFFWLLSVFSQWRGEYPASQLHNIHIMLAK